MANWIEHFQCSVSYFIFTKVYGLVVELAMKSNHQTAMNMKSTELYSTSHSSFSLLLSFWLSFKVRYFIFWLPHGWFNWIFLEWQVWSLMHSVNCVISCSRYRTTWSPTASFAASERITLIQCHMGSILMWPKSIIWRTTCSFWCTWSTNRTRITPVKRRMFGNYIKNERGTFSQLESVSENKKRKWVGVLPARTRTCFLYQIVWLSFFVFFCLENYFL